MAAVFTFEVYDEDKHGPNLKDGQELLKTIVKSKNPHHPFFKDENHPWFEGSAEENNAVNIPNQVTHNVDDFGFY